MANPEHLEILKQGVEAWNKWRGEHSDIHPDLTAAVLGGANLERASLYGTNLDGARLRTAHMYGADLSHASLGGAVLKSADLRLAVLNGVYLHGADLEYANLDGANLGRSILSRANLSHASLDGADFTGAIFSSTVFADNDLSGAKGLDGVYHSTPSSIGVDTISKSRGKIPEAFLRGCGLSDWQVENAKLYQPELINEEITGILYRVHDLRAHQAIQISPLFISYTHADVPFVDAMEAHLNGKGVRFWRDVHHSTAGRLERQIDRAIHLNPTVLLVLSEHSVKSDWVEHEARLARKLEQEMDRDVLCPVALDDSWKTCRWPERLREQIMEYNVLDFSNWQNPDYMRRMFTRLIEGLGLFYK